MTCSPTYKQLLEKRYERNFNNNTCHIIYYLLRCVANLRTKMKTKRQIIQEYVDRNDVKGLAEYFLAYLEDELSTSLREETK